MKARFPCLGCRIVTNSCTFVSLIHFTKLLNKKIEGSLKGLFVVFLRRFPYNPILYYAQSSLLKKTIAQTIDYLWDFPLCFIKGDVFTSEFVPCFYFKLRSVSAAKKKRRNICLPKRRLIFLLRTKRPTKFKHCWKRVPE